MRVEQLKELTIEEIRNIDIQSLNKTIIHLKNILSIAYKEPQKFIFNVDPVLEKICEEKYYSKKLKDIEHLEKMTLEDAHDLKYLVFSLTNRIQHHYELVEKSISTCDVDVFLEKNYLLPELLKGNTYKFLQHQILSSIKQEDIGFYEVLLNHPFFTTNNTYNKQFLEENKANTSTKSLGVNQPEKQYSIKDTLLFHIHSKCLNNKNLYEKFKTSSLFNEQLFSDAIDNRLTVNTFYMIEPSILLNLVKEKGYFLSPKQTLLMVHHNKIDTLKILFENDALTKVDTSEDMQVTLLEHALTGFSTESAEYLLTKYPDNEIYQNISLSDFITTSNIQELFSPEKSDFRRLCVENFFRDEDFLNLLSSRVDILNKVGLLDFIKLMYEQEDQKELNKIFTIFSHTADQNFNQDVAHMHSKYLLKLSLNSQLIHNEKNAPKLKI